MRYNKNQYHDTCKTLLRFIQNINIAVWNSLGLKCKLDGTSNNISQILFLEFINNVEIICFLETRADSTQHFSINNFVCNDVLKKKHKKASSFCEEILL